MSPESDLQKPSLIEQRERGLAMLLSQADPSQEPALLVDLRINYSIKGVRTLLPRHTSIMGVAKLSEAIGAIESDAIGIKGLERLRVRAMEALVDKGLCRSVSAEWAIAESRLILVARAEGNSMELESFQDNVSERMSQINGSWQRCLPSLQWESKGVNRIEPDSMALAQKASDEPWRASLSPSQRQAQTLVDVAMSQPSLARWMEARQLEEIARPGKSRSPKGL